MLVLRRRMGILVALLLVLRLLSILACLCWLRLWELWWWWLLLEVLLLLFVPFKLLLCTVFTRRNLSCQQPKIGLRLL
jgi:sterol desaturase/sphingolipid hydroxylase (fatty acid hydroxylase superfamily)